MHEKGIGRALKGTATGLLCTAVAGCSSDHSIMNGQSDEADRVAALGWLMFALSGVVFVLVIGLLAVGLLRRTRRHGEHEHPTLRNDRRWIVAGGVAMPSVVVLLLSVLTVWALADENTGAQVKVSVIGHQYWWEVRYEGTPAVSANELHLPVGEDVEITLSSVDVIHSLWVPELGPKRDLIPGHVNVLTWRAEESGSYRGVCAEFCGLQHANMALEVIAQPRDEYDDWLNNEAANAVAPASPDATTGLAAFVRLPCSSCHTVRGTDAVGTAGPDLTHFAGRAEIGAGVAPNDRGHLGGWIADSQTLKPGNLMPPIPMAPEDLQTLLVYLESLR